MVQYKADKINISSNCNLSSPWYTHSWKLALVMLNNNHSSTHLILFLIKRLNCVKYKNIPVCSGIRDTCSNLCWWMQKTFLKILVTTTIVKIQNFKNCESTAHLVELQGSLVGTEKNQINMIYNIFYFMNDDNMIGLWEIYKLFYMSLLLSNYNYNYTSLVNHFLALFYSMWNTI